MNRLAKRPGRQRQAESTAQQFVLPAGPLPWEAGGCDAA